MQKFLRTLMLAAVMLLPFASQAQTLTVCDGTVNNQYIPFDGYNADAAQHNQMIYPATDLTAMSGLAITQMVFYIDPSASNGSNTAASRLGTWTVSLGETTATTLSALDNTTTLTQVYQGYFDCSTGTLTIEFDQAYMYNGGNLLVDLNHAAASWNRWYFLGVTTTDDVAYNSYDDDSYSFLPKCTFTYGAAPTCFKVTNLTIGAATSNSLTLTWTDALNTGATYSVYSVTATDTTLVQANITGTTYTVTGLTANTAYAYAVKTDCGAGDVTDITTPVSGRTECAATTPLPYAEDFSGYTGLPSYPYYGPATLPYCWGFYSNGTNTAATGTGTTSTYYGGVGQYSGTSYGSMVSGNPYLYMPIQITGSAVTSSTYIGYETARGNTKYAVMPAFDAALSTLQISFDYKMSTAYSATASATVLELGYITNDDTSTFVSIWNHQSVSSTQHVTELNLSTLAAAAPAGARLAFKFSGVHNGTGTSSYNTVHCGIDNILVEALPSCLRISDLAVSETSSNSISLTWSDTLNTGATYSVYTITPSDTTLVEAGISTTTYTVTGLTANTAYVFGVVANCSATDASVMTVVSGRTDCASETMPWSESFDTWESKSPCWKFLTGAYNMGAGTPTTTTSGWAIQTSTYGSYINLTGKALGFNLYSTNRYWAVTPNINITSDAAMLNVDVAVSAWSASTPNYDSNDTLAFAISTNGGSTWTNLLVLDSTALNALSNTYTTISVPVLNHNGETVRFAIFGGSSASGGDNRIIIDNVSVGEAPACIAVTGLTADSITAHEALLTWIGEASSYNVYDMADTTLITTVYDTAANLTNLTADASHTIGVAAVCGSEESDTMTVTFRTLVSCPVPTGLAVTLTPGNGTVADINWVPGGEESSWEICLNNDMANTIVTYDTFYNFTSLTAEQAYTVKVRAICGIDDTSAWTAPIIFTPTNSYTLTVNEGTTTNSYVPIYGTWVDDITKSQFIIPAASLTSIQYGRFTKLTFYASQANVNWGVASFNVYLTETTDTAVTALADYTTMTQVYAGSLSISNNKMEVTFTTPYTYMGGNLKVGFLQTVEGDYSGSTWYGVTATGASMGGYGSSVSQRNFLPKMTIDYVPGTAPSCLPVTGLTAVNVTADSATLTWNGTAAGSYTIIDMSDSSYVASVTDTFYVLTGLTAMTSYTYGVAAECSSDNSDTIPVSFATACGIVTLPYTEGFEANSGTRNCWTTDGPGSWSFAAGDYSASTGAYEGSANAKITHSSTGNVTKLISPVLDLNGATGMQLTYAHIQRAWGSDIDELRVYYRTSATDTWNVVAAYTNEVATWTVDQVMLPATTYQVAFEMTDSYGYGVGVDSVVFTPLSASFCYPVTNVTVDSVDATSVTISWADTANAGNFSVYNGTTYVGTTTDTFYTFTGLTASTGYTFGVRALCSATDTSTLETVNARTDCAGGSCQITIYAEDSYGDGWGSDLVIAQNGATVATYRMADQGLEDTPIYDTFQVSVCSGAPVTFTWVSGGTYAYDDEASFTIVDGGNGVVYTCTDASTLTDGAVFATATDPCPSCIAPDVTVDSVDATSVSISWTGTATSYSVYNGTTYVANVTTNTYTFTGLTASTNYTFGVRANCSATDSSAVATVNTRTDCANGSCNITIASGNYGFLGASIDVMQGGVILATVSDGFTQSPYTESVNVCSGMPVTLVFNSGYYDNYVSFTVSDGGNTVVYTCTDGSTLTDGAVFTTITDACPSCMPVANLTVDSADLTSVSISWTGNAASYDVYNGTTFVANVTTTNYTFTGLTASTSYTFGVQAICSATDSANMVTIAAMTACADVTTLPYMEGFENGLGCWSTVNGSADGQPWTAYDCAGLSSITPHSGLYVASSWSWSGSEMHADAWLISPKFVLPTVNAGDTLNFNWWHITNGSYADSYSVVLSTTTNDTAAFTTVIRPYGIADSTWTMQTVDLTAYAGQSVYIAFHHVDYDNNYLLIDEISLALGAAPVPAPDTMTVTFAVNDATMGTTNPAPGTYQYLSGDTVRFEAIATTGHVFTGWQVTVGSQSFTATGLSVYFDVNSFLRYGNVVNVTANFEPGTPDSTTITYAVNDATLGTTNPAPGTYTIYVGDSINASATAYTGSVLAAWVMDIIVDSAVYSSDTLYSDDPEFTNPWYVGRLPQNFVDAGASIVITAIFEDEDPGTTYYTITGVANDPAMGYVLGSNRYAAGSEVVLTAVANNGYRFVRWSNGETTATITFTATANVELTAFFEVDNTGIEDANMANVSIYSTDNKIVVRGAEGQSIYVFDLNGRVMASENNAAESVEFRMQTTGVYLVKVGTAAAKRVVLMR